MTIIDYITNIFELKQKYLDLTSDLKLNNIKIYNSETKKYISINIEQELKHLIVKLIQNNFTINYSKEHNKVFFDIPFISKRYKINQTYQDTQNQINEFSCPAITSICSLCKYNNGLCEEHNNTQKRNTRYYKYYEIVSIKNDSLIIKILYNIMALFGRFHTSICISYTDQGHLIKIYNLIQILDNQINNYISSIIKNKMIKVSEKKDKSIDTTIDKKVTKKVTKKNTKKIHNTKLNTNTIKDIDYLDNMDDIQYEIKIKYSIYDIISRYLVPLNAEILKNIYLNNREINILQSNIELLLDYYGNEFILYCNKIHNDAFVRLTKYDISTLILQAQQKMFSKINIPEIDDNMRDYLRLLTYNLSTIFLDSYIDGYENMIKNYKYFYSFIRNNKLNWCIMLYVLFILFSITAKNLKEFNTTPDFFLGSILLPDLKKYFRTHFNISCLRFNIMHFLNVVNQLLSINRKYYSAEYKQNLINTIMYIKFDNIFIIDNIKLFEKYKFSLSLIDIFINNNSMDIYLLNKIKLIKNNYILITEQYNVVDEQGKSIIYKITEYYDRLLNYYLAFLLSSNNDNDLIKSYIDNLSKITIILKLFITNKDCDKIIDQYITSIDQLFKWSDYDNVIYILYVGICNDLKYFLNDSSIIKIEEYIKSIKSLNEYFDFHKNIHEDISNTYIDLIKNKYPQKISTQMST